MDGAAGRVPLFAHLEVENGPLVEIVLEIMQSKEMGHLPAGCSRLAFALHRDQTGRDLLQRRVTDQESGEVLSLILVPGS